MALSTPGFMLTPKQGWGASNSKAGAKTNGFSQGTYGQGLTYGGNNGNGEMYRPPVNQPTGTQTMSWGNTGGNGPIGSFMDSSSNGFNASSQGQSTRPREFVDPGGLWLGPPQQGFDPNAANQAGAYSGPQQGWNMGQQGPTGINQGNTSPPPPSMGWNLPGQGNGGVGGDIGPIGAQPPQSGGYGGFSVPFNPVYSQSSQPQTQLAMAGGPTSFNPGSTMTGSPLGAMNASGGLVSGQGYDAARLGPNDPGAIDPLSPIGGGGVPQGGTNGAGGMPPGPIPDQPSNGPPTPLSGMPQPPQQSVNPLTPVNVGGAQPGGPLPPLPQLPILIPQGQANAGQKAQPAAQMPPPVQVPGGGFQGAMQNQQQFAPGPRPNPFGQNDVAARDIPNVYGNGGQQSVPQFPGFSAIPSDYGGGGFQSYGSLPQLPGNQTMDTGSTSQTGPGAPPPTPPAFDRPAPPTQQQQQGGGNTGLSQAQRDAISQMPTSLQSTIANMLSRANNGERVDWNALPGSIRQMVQGLANGGTLSGRGDYTNALNNTGGTGSSVRDQLNAMGSDAMPVSTSDPAQARQTLTSNFNQQQQQLMTQPGMDGRARQAALMQAQQSYQNQMNAFNNAVNSPGTGRSLNFQTAGGRPLLTFR